MQALKLLLAALGAMLFCLAQPTQALASDKPRAVDCVWPGETLQGALSSLAEQAGYTLDMADTAESVDMEEIVYVLARGTTLDHACKYLSASSGLYVRPDHAARRIRVREYTDNTTEPAVTRLYDTTKLCRGYTAYLNRFGKVGDPLMPATTPTQTLLALAHDLIDGSDLAGNPGSAVGSRILMTRTSDAHARIAEVFALLDTPGESASLQRDRKHRKHLAELKTTRDFDAEPLSVALYVLFEKCPSPVVLDRSMLDAIDLLGEATSIRLAPEGGHLQGLLDLAAEQGFEIDDFAGAIRLHCNEFTFAESSYRVFDLSRHLDALEKEYLALRADPGAEDGFRGSLRTEGGTGVILNAVYLQLVNQGLEPLAYEFGTRLIVCGSAEVIDRAVDIIALLTPADAPANKTGGEEK